ncbi:hypothetical protein ABNF97_29740 [Plantactinospora sp. B6F1]|uniref:hypothetical protein n=1 Tax=Plantactinospora sp. B6F1 TaxID=3158971 RepID=UPI0032D927A1
MTQVIERRPPVPAPRLRTWYGGLGLGLAVLPVVVALTGCAEPDDGRALAKVVAEEQADLVGKGLGYRDRVRSAEHIAATEIPAQTQGYGWTARLAPLHWSGRVSGGERATIDVRLDVTVEAEPASGFASSGNSAGQAGRCYRYQLQLYRYTTHDEVDCPAAALPPEPSASPIQQLPKDAHDRLSKALRTATPATLDSAVRSAFPEEYVSVDVALHEGWLVAAVGVPAERDCLLLVRSPVGAIVSPGYNRTSLEPGELGCSTGLFESPPR